MRDFKKVSQDDFYKEIGPKDVVLNVKGSFPYTTEFKLRYGKLVGKSVDSYDGSKAKTKTEYYLATD